MKRYIALFVLILFCIISVFAFHRNDTSITGRVNPVDGASLALAIGGKDSSTSNIVSGNFNLLVKPGLYKVSIRANEPYKDAVLENITVKDGQTVDVGEVMLQK